MHGVSSRSPNAIENVRGNNQAHNKKVRNRKNTEERGAFMEIGACAQRLRLPSGKNRLAVG